MEAHEGQFRSVHVLRHTFRPSEALTEQLQHMVETQRGATASRFILTSTREVAVDALEFQNYRYDLAVHSLQEQFHKHAGGVALQSAAYKFTPRGDFKIRFTPAYSNEFEALVQPIDSLPNIVEQSARGGRDYLQLQIDASRLVGRRALAEAWHILREDIASPARSHLYSVVPYDISGPERTVVAPPQLISYDTLYPFEFDGPAA